MLVANCTTGSVVCLLLISFLALCCPKQSFPNILTHILKVERTKNGYKVQLIYENCPQPVSRVLTQAPGVCGLHYVCCPASPGWSPSSGFWPVSPAYFGVPLSSSAGAVLCCPEDRSRENSGLLFISVDHLHYLHPGRIFHFPSPVGCHEDLATKKNKSYKTNKLKKNFFYLG